MKIIDTSVWIPFFRRKGDLAAKQTVANLISASKAAYTCPVRLELMFGARDQELQKLTQGLSFAHRIELARLHWDLASNAVRKLRKAGVNLPHDDLLIATVAWEQKLQLICRDKHFSLIQKHAYPELKVEQI